MDRKSVDTLLANKAMLMFEEDAVVASFRIGKTVGLRDFMDVVATLKEEFGVGDENISVYAGEGKIDIQAAVGPRP